MSRSRGVIFAAHEVRAALARPRGLLLRPIVAVVGRGPVREFGESSTPGYDWHFRDRHALWNDLRHQEIVTRCPYGKAGDLIAVRETWAMEPGVHPDDAEVLYRATDPGWDDNKTGLRWNSAAQMPLSHSRLSLRITGVTVRLLKAVTAQEADLLGCGLERQKYEGSVPLWLTAEGRPTQFADIAYRSFWDLRYGKCAGLASGSDPWVWGIEFERALLAKEGPVGSGVSGISASECTTEEAP